MALCIKYGVDCSRFAGNKNREIRYFWKSICEDCFMELPAVDKIAVALFWIADSEILNP